MQPSKSRTLTLKQIVQEENWTELLFAVLMLEDTVSTRESARLNRVGKATANLQEEIAHQTQETPQQTTTADLVTMLSQVIFQQSLYQNPQLSQIPEISQMGNFSAVPRNSTPRQHELNSEQANTLQRLQQPQQQIPATASTKVTDTTWAATHSSVATPSSNKENRANVYSRR